MVCLFHMREIAEAHGESVALACDQDQAVFTGTLSRSAPDSARVRTIHRP